jgi:hypothetical protein
MQKQHFLHISLKNDDNISLVSLMNDSFSCDIKNGIIEPKVGLYSIKTSSQCSHIFGSVRNSTTPYESLFFSLICLIKLQIHEKKIMTFITSCTNNYLSP